MKAVDRVPNTDFYGLHTGNHNKYQNPHEQYKQVYRQASGASNLTVNGTTQTAWLQTTFTCPSPSQYTIELFLDFLPSGGSGILAAAVTIDGGSALPKNLATSSANPNRMPLFKKWISPQLTEGSHTVVVSFWRVSGTSTFELYASNSELIVTGP